MRKSPHFNHLNIMNEIINFIQEHYLLFSAEELMKDLRLDEDEVKQLILKLKKEKKIVIMYKLKTNERFLNFDNDWTPHLQELCKIFTSTQGNSFDGSEIHNLEFKFKLQAS